MPGKSKQLLFLISNLQSGDDSYTSNALYFYQENIFWRGEEKTGYCFSVLHCAIYWPIYYNNVLVWKEVPWFYANKIHCTTRESRNATHISTMPKSVNRVGYGISVSSTFPGRSQTYPKIHFEALYHFRPHTDRVNSNTSHDNSLSSIGFRNTTGFYWH